MNTLSIPQNQIKYNSFDVTSPIQQKTFINGDPNFFSASSISFNTVRVDNMLGKIMQYHPWIYACIDRIYTNLIALDRRVVVKGKDNTLDSIDHPINDLFKKPNPLMSSMDFWSLVFVYLLLNSSKGEGGQVFILPIGKTGERVDLRSGQIPAELWPYSENIVKKSNESTSREIRWEINFGDGRKRIYENYELIRIRCINPYDQCKGLSKTFVALQSANQDLKADEYNRTWFEKFGAIGGILSTKDHVTKDQAIETREAWEEEYGGSHNAGRIAVLGNGYEYDKITQNQADAQFIEQRADNRKRVQAIFGVPDSEISIFESGMNKATAREASRNFWEKTLTPFDQMVEKSIHDQFIQYIDGKIFYKADYSKVKALREDRSQMIIDAATMVKDMNVPPAVAIKTVGLEVDDVEKYPWLDRTYVQERMIDIEDLDQVDRTTRRGSSSNNQNQPKKPKKDSKKFLEDTLKKSIGWFAERRKLADNHLKVVINPGVTKLHAKFQKFFNDITTEMLDNVDKWVERARETRSIEESKEIDLNPLEILFNLELANKSMLEFYRPVLEDQMDRDIEAIDDQYNIQWVVDEEIRQQFFEDRERQLKKITTLRFETARRTVTKIVRESIESNSSVKEAAEKLKNAIKEIKQLGAKSAGTIARTEIASISSRARYAAFTSTSDVQGLEWLSARDELVRHGHGIDGERVETGSNFSNGLRYPLDPRGSARNVINCRCTVLPIFKDDDNDDSDGSVENG